MFCQRPSWNRGNRLVCTFGGSSKLGRLKGCNSKIFLEFDSLRKCEKSVANSLEYGKGREIARLFSRGGGGGGRNISSSFTPKKQKFQPDGPLGSNAGFTFALMVGTLLLVIKHI